MWRPAGRQAILCLVLAIAAPGCSDWGDEPGDGSTGPTEPPPGVSFAADVQPIFDASCVGCHGSGGNAGLDLRPGVSHGNLVGVPSTESSLQRVVPGDPQTSWLHLKLTGAQDVGSPMPPGGPLPADQIATVRAWIETGALDN